MAHIHTADGQHDHTASAYIVRLDMEEPRLLLHIHKKLGVLLQIGGHIELDENPWESVAHEILEESGYELEQLELLQPKERIKQFADITLHPVPVVMLTHLFSQNPDHYHDDTAWAFVTNQKPKHPLSKDESADIRWMSAKDLHDAPADLLPPNVKETGLFVLETCTPNWDRVKL